MTSNWNVCDIFNLHYALAHAPCNPPNKTKIVYFTNVSVATLNFRTTYSTTLLYSNSHLSLLCCWHQDTIRRNSMYEYGVMSNDLTSNVVVQLVLIR